MVMVIVQTKFCVDSLKRLVLLFSRIFLSRIFSVFENETIWCKSGGDIRLRHTCMQIDSKAVVTPPRTLLPRGESVWLHTAASKTCSHLVGHLDLTPHLRRLYHRMITGYGQTWRHSQNRKCTIYPNPRREPNYGHNMHRKFGEVRTRGSTAMHVDRLITILHFPTMTEYYGK